MFFLLTYLVKCNTLLSNKPIKRTKTTKKILGTIIDKDKIELKIPLQ